MTTLHLRTSSGQSPLRLGFLLIPLALAWFALSSTARAADGVVPGGNTTEGKDALFNNTTGIDNTAIGFKALLSNSTGRNNTAIGYQTLPLNTTGGNNTASGFEALFSNTIGAFNTANGVLALFSNTEGAENTAIGDSVLFSNTTGGDNTAIGDGALISNTMGNDNTAIGGNALKNNTTGGGNIALGAFAGSAVTGNNNIDIGNNGAAAESGIIRIGSNQTATFIAGISGVDEGGTVTAVTINGNGQLGTQAVALSSRRFKKEIKPMDKASEAILALKPVTFRYKKELDPKGLPQFGLVAEEVAEVNPDLIVRDDKGEIYTVRYDAVNAMLLNEFLKEHRKVEALQVSFAQQQKDFQSKLAEQQKQIKALTSGLEKVNNQLELNKPAPRTVSNQ